MRMLLIYSPDGSNVCGSRGGEFEKIVFGEGFKSRKIVFIGDMSYSLVQILSL